MILNMVMESSNGLLEVTIGVNTLMMSKLVLEQ